jgi:hypothetical protein
MDLWKKHRSINIAEAPHDNGHGGALRQQWMLGNDAQQWANKGVEALTSSKELLLDERMWQEFNIIFNQNKKLRTMNKNIFYTYAEGLQIRYREICWTQGPGKKMQTQADVGLGQEQANRSNPWP